MSSEEPTEQRKPVALISYQTGGFVDNDVVVPENQNPRFIRSTEYFKKYRYLLPISFIDRDLAVACRKWHEDESLPDEKRIGLISTKELVNDTHMRSTRTGKLCELKRKRWQWFIFDVPPDEHPGWLAYYAGIIRVLERAGRYIASEFKTLAPKYLERFDNARKDLDHTQYRIKELAKMVGASREVIRSWTEIGIKDFGKLPHINADDTIKPFCDEKGQYIHRPTGRIDYYYATKDIRRFLKGELGDPKKQFKTIDDATEGTNIQAIATQSGYYVYYPERAFPLSFKGFMDWAHKNIVFYDRRTRRLMPFRPSPKQIEFYRNVFALKEDGYLKFIFNYACRPRGDYKTFDIAAIVLFRFFNLENERIYLVTNSVKQTTHLIYFEAYDLIKKSPTLSKMLNTPALDIQKDGIYLRTGRGVENVCCFIEITSSEGGARSNATCVAWSEAWKFKGNESDVAEIMQSIRGVHNSMFLAESTVAPKGHWFQRQYEISMSNEPDSSSYFQYYNGSERQNPKVTKAFLESAKKSFPIHYKMFFDNKWEDAESGLFSESQIIEMGTLGIDGGIWRNNELIETIHRIVDLQEEIRKYDSGIDMSGRKAELNTLRQRLNLIDYQIPASFEILNDFGRVFDCEFIIGLGLDRAKQLTERSDRTVLATVARGILKPEKWGTDRLFFLLNIDVFEESSGHEIMNKIIAMTEMYSPATIYIDLEDYNVIDLHDHCKKEGLEAEIAPNSLKHQIKIFSECKAAAEGGYLKIPFLNIWFDENDFVHYSKPPFGKFDIVREEAMVFEYREGSGKGGRGSKGFFGSTHKFASGRVPIGKAKDDTWYAIAHAMNASIRGDIPISLLKTVFANAAFNTENIGDYST